MGRGMIGVGRVGGRKGARGGLHGSLGKRCQVHPARSPRKHMALVESAHTVILVVHIVGDVLEVLEMGAAGGGQVRAMASVPSPHPWDLTHRMSRSLRRGNSQCAMFSTGTQDSSGWRSPRVRPPAPS